MPKIHWYSGTGKRGINKIARIKTYKTPEKGAGWVAYHPETIAHTGKSKAGCNSRPG
jgi:hypothetical protein